MSSSMARLAKSSSKARARVSSIFQHSQLWKTLPAKPVHRFPQCGKCIAARFGADFHKAVQIVFHFAESYAAAVNAFQTEKQAEHPGEG